MKKQLLKLLTGLAISSIIVASEATYAKAATAVTYDFSSYAIPEGQPKTLAVDDITIALMKQQPTTILAFVDALATRYNNASAVINKAVEIQYLTGVCNGTVIAGNHVPCYTTAVANIATPVTVPVVDTNKNTTPKITITTPEVKATSVDVNITTQTLTLYSGDSVILTTPVVTGNINRGNGTPTGEFKIYTKEMNRTLIGKNNSYRSWVKYWERITPPGSAYGSIGLHSASWRSIFGGEIYKTNGSHGCINIPTEAMAIIYSTTEKGLPVNVHY